jgi:hypothetical protein
MSSWSSFTATLEQEVSSLASAQLDLGSLCCGTTFSNTFGQGFMVTKVLLEALYMEHAERDELP